jgi:hypothetical protein
MLAPSKSPRQLAQDALDAAVVDAYEQGHTDGKSEGFALALALMRAAMEDLHLPALSEPAADTEVPEPEELSPPSIQHSLQGLMKYVREALEKAGITTVAQVSEKTDEELLAIPGIGPKGLQHLRLGVKAFLYS